MIFHIFIWVMTLSLVGLYGAGMYLRGNLDVLRWSRESIEWVRAGHGSMPELRTNWRGLLGYAPGFIFIAVLTSPWLR